MEREKFEESCRHAFDEAAISPSAKVWTNIELELERARGGELKRRLLFYQMLAAASVVFAMAIGGAGYYYAFDRGVNPRQLSVAQASQDQVEEPEQTRRSDLEEPASQEIIASAEPTRDGSKRETVAPAIESKGRSEMQPSVYGRANSFDKADAGRNTGVAIRGENPSDVVGDGRSLPPAVDQAGTHSSLPSQISEADLGALYAARDVTLTFAKEEEEVDPVVAMLARLERREREVRSEKEDKSAESENENLWTSIGFAAGSFNAMRAPSASGSSGSASRVAMAAAPIVDQEAKATGYSYSMGVNVGTKISERWVLQGGVNYLTHASEYTADNVVADGPGYLMAAEKFKPIGTNAVVSADSESELRNSIVYSAPYNVNNSMRYLSIPLQAGYLLINNAFGLQLNAGVATDLFLQNTVKGEGDQLGETTQSLGSDSPYRTVNLSGLLGTEVSYRFSPRYRVSLNPGIRYPFNTIYKSELGVQSSPLTFDVGLRFRYIFN